MKNLYNNKCFFLSINFLILTALNAKLYTQVNSPGSITQNLLNSTKAQARRSVNRANSIVTRALEPTPSTTGVVGTAPVSSSIGTTSPSGTPSTTISSLLPIGSAH